MWRSCRDNLLQPGDTHAEFARSLATVAWAAGRRPRYVAEACGRFSLLAVAVTKGLHLRRVVFVKHVKVSANGTSRIGRIPSGGIVEIRALSGAAPQAVADALRSLWLAAIDQGLHPVTVAQIDGTAEASPAEL